MKAMSELILRVKVWISWCKSVHFIPGLYSNIYKLKVLFGAAHSISFDMAMAMSNATVSIRRATDSIKQFTEKLEEFK